MNEQELCEYAKQRGWSFVRVPAMACSGYWKDKEGNCYYARKATSEASMLSAPRSGAKQMQLPLQRQNNRRGR